MNRSKDPIPIQKNNRRVSDGKRLAPGSSCIICFFERLPSELAVIVFEYNPLELWPLVIDRKDITTRLPSINLPLSTRPKVTQGGWREARIFYSRAYFQTVILDLVRLSVGPHRGKIKEIAQTYWAKIPDGCYWKIGHSFAFHMRDVDLHGDLSRCSLTLYGGYFPKSDTELADIALREYGYEAGGSEIEVNIAQAYVRHEMRDCFGSLFGLLEHLEVDMCRMVTPVCLYPWIGIWRPHLEEIKTFRETMEAAPDSNLIQIVSMIHTTLSGFLGWEYPFYQTPGFRRVKDACLSLLGDLEKRGCPLPLFAPESRTRIEPVSERMPEFSPYFVSSEASSQVSFLDDGKTIEWILERCT